MNTVEYTARVLSRLARKHSIEWDSLSREQRAIVCEHIEEHVLHNKRVAAGLSPPMVCAYRVRDTADGIAFRLTPREPWRETGSSDD